jgi:lipopolysaccharide transport system ATP-binding protein
MSFEHAQPRAAAGAGEVVVSRVSKCYHIYNRPQDRLKQALVLHRRRYYREFWALRDINLSASPGSAIGIIGRNGAGKSTLLQLIVGTLAPTSGSVRTSGRIAAMLALGSGFNPQYTGRENVYLSGAIMGIPRAEMDERFDDIAAFADIGEFIDQPVKSYSTGMFARLAFAVSVCSEPDILVVDEILSVGDAEFQQRCLLRMRELRERGVTLLLASHGMDTVKSTCERAIVLEKGEILFAGSAPEACDTYLNLTRDLLNQQKQRRLGRAFTRSAPQPRPAGSRRYGTGHVQIQSARLLDEDGEDASAFLFGEQITLEVRFRAMADMDNLSVSFLVRDRTGIDLLGTTTFEERVPLGPLPEGRDAAVRFRFMNHLRAGSYGVCVAVNRLTRRDLTDNVLLDQIDDAAAFECVGRDDRPVHYKVHLPVTVETLPAEASSAAASAQAQHG